MTLYEELDSHYKMWSDDMNIRLTRKDGFHDITDAYYGRLPDDWPYMSKVVVPLVRTSLVEKNGRLLNSKLRGRLVPREGGDMVSAHLNNSILDYQWDTANDGGSMQVKLGISDMDTRLYGSKFAYIYWKYERYGERVKFDGNEMLPLSIVDCGIDPTASHIRDAKWFQMRRWEKFEDLEAAVDGNGKKLYRNLDKVKRAMSGKMQKQSARRNEYTPRTLQLRSLEDHTGEDKSFPVILVVTELREDRFYTFLPDYGEIISDIPNPFAHGKIPIAQLRYYHVENDPIGESEVEPVLGLWRAIQATVNAYLDEMILKIRPPLKVIENAVRVETIVYGPEAQWLVDRQDAIEEMRSSGDTLQYYQTTYQSMVSAFNTAMGDLSQGTSAFQSFDSTDAKTATEVKASVRQQNTRDQKNQNDLVEFIKDIMMMWMSNNKQFLFSDPRKKEHILRIVGEDKFALFQRAGMADYELVEGAEQLISDNIEIAGGDMSDEMIMEMYEMASIPKYPIITNPGEKDPTKIKMKPKMVVSTTGSVADITVIPQDLEGTYDYIPDVKSMAAGAQEEYMQARQRLIADLTQSPNVVQYLMQEGYKPKYKELYVSTLEDTGLRDAERFFEKVPTTPQIGAGNAQMGGSFDPFQNPSIPGASQANLGGGIPQQMAQTGGFPNNGAIPQGI